MKVHEFIEVLRQCDQDAEIVIAPSDLQGVAEYATAPIVEVYDADAYPHGIVEVIAKRGLKNN